MIELEGLDKIIIGYSKSLSKILFGSLDTRNKVDVPLQITSYMDNIFKGYPLVQPIFHSPSIERNLNPVVEQKQDTHEASTPTV